MELEKQEGINSCDSTSVSSYFDFYSKLSNQQNMLQDYVRTQVYYKAVSSNPTDFTDKTIIDVGTGSGILAMFAAQSGAKQVYAIEASSSVKYAQALVTANKLDGKITIINKQVESTTEIDVPNKVDTIISEPLGILLVNERMLESFLFARDQFLKPGGKMFPSSSVMHFIPFSDELLYLEQIEKVKFWASTEFFKVNLTSLYDIALKEKLSQPIIEAYNPKCQ